MLRRRIIFIGLFATIFFSSIIATYKYGIDLPKTGVSSRTLGLVVDTIDRIGYIGIFVLMTLESCGVPIPSEIIMPFSGYLVSKGHLSYWMVVLVGSLANLFGSVIAFFIGSKGRPFLDKYGKYLFIHKHHLEYAEGLFERYGALIIFLGRNMPVIRTYISFPAGISRMNFAKFSILTFLGSIPWNMMLVYIGIKMGEHWDKIVEFFEKLDSIIILLAILTIIYLFFFEAEGE